MQDLVLILAQWLATTIWSYCVSSFLYVQFKNVFITGVGLQLKLQPALTPAYS